MESKEKTFHDLDKLSSFIAKTNPYQSLAKHTAEVLKALDVLLKQYGNHFTEEEKELFYILCKYHDYGKINTKFQEKIKQNQWHIEGEIPHSFFSPYFLEKEEITKKYGERIYHILCTAIYHHHARESDIEDETYHTYFTKYVKPIAEQTFSKELSYQTFRRKKILFQFPNKTPKELNPEDYLLFAFMKGILNRCDYAASASAKEMEMSISDNGIYLEDTILNRYHNTLKSAQKYMLENQNQNLVVVAPTGSGKTEGALLWIGKEKGFYTLPLKVASTAIYDRIYTTYQYHKVSLLHSDSLSILAKGNNFEQSYAQYQDMRLFSYPLTVCTVDQIFKFPFKALGMERMLATLAYSKVVIDEIQMYSSTILASLIMGLSMVKKLGGQFLIMTATIPKFFLGLLDTYIGKEHYRYKECYQDTISQRHIFSLQDDDFAYDKILESSMDKKVLVICNTIKKAKAVFLEFQKRDKKRVRGLLHSQFIKKDRRVLEESILNEKENGIWVTTQIVEASLDIDFDELHTEMAPADSLLQRFGRCYRKRVYEKQEANIFIYNTRNGVPYIYDKDLYDRSFTFLKAYENQYFTEKAKIEYIDRVYLEEEIKNTAYYTDIQSKIKFIKNIYPAEYDKKDVDGLFREIFTVLIVPDSVMDKHIEEIRHYLDILESNKPHKEKLQAEYALMEYTVSVSKYGVKNKTLIPGTDIYRVEGMYDSVLGFLGNEGEKSYVS